jgi:hypothetical protein
MHVDGLEINFNCPGSYALKAAIFKALSNLRRINNWIEKYDGALNIN